MMLQLWVILYFLSVRGQITPRLQCKWMHGDSGSQNLERSTGILVYGSFKIRQEPSGHLEPPPLKDCLPTKQTLDQTGCTRCLYLS